MEGAGEGAARRRDVEACELAGKRRDDEASGSQIGLRDACIKCLRA
jgi:hypothetical protein